MVSPEHETHFGCADPPEPPEYGCDVVEIEADSKRDAVILGVSMLLKDHKSWASMNRQDGLPPWAGYKVEEVPTDCGLCGSDLKGVAEAATPQAGCSDCNPIFGSEATPVQESEP